METDPLRRGTEMQAYSSGNNDINDVEKDGEHRFECNVCLEDVIQPIVTQCGHLYCWPCLYRWLNTGHNTCPICKAGISEENVIPLFIKGNEGDPRGPKREDSGSYIPNRPNALRPEPVAPGNRGDGSNNTNSTSFGFFPSLFSLQVQNFVEPLNTSEENGVTTNTSYDSEHAFLSRVLLLLFTVIITTFLLF